MDRMTETQDEFFLFLPNPFSQFCQDFHKKEAQKIFRRLSKKVCNRSICSNKLSVYSVSLSLIYLFCLFNKFIYVKQNIHKKI